METYTIERLVKLGGKLCEKEGRQTVSFNATAVSALLGLNNSTHKISDGAFFYDVTSSSFSHSDLPAELGERILAAIADRLTRETAGVVRVIFSEDSAFRTTSSGLVEEIPAHELGKNQ